MALDLLALLVFSGLASASLAIIVRAFVSDILGRVDLVLETRPLSCNTCMAFWGCMIVALVCLHPAALGGVVVAVKLLDHRSAS